MCFLKNDKMYQKMTKKCHFSPKYDIFWEKMTLFGHFLAHFVIFWNLLKNISFIIFTQKICFEKCAKMCQTMCQKMFKKASKKCVTKFVQKTIKNVTKRAKKIIRNVQNPATIFWPDLSRRAQDKYYNIELLLNIEFR